MKESSLKALLTLRVIFLNLFSSSRCIKIDCLRPEEHRTGTEQRRDLLTRLHSTARSCRGSQIPPGQAE